MTVSELITFLQTQDQTLEVCFSQFSEQALLQPQDITVKKLGLARPDGWIQNERPDKPSQDYLSFPGN